MKRLINILWIATTTMPLHAQEVVNDSIYNMLEFTMNEVVVSAETVSREGDRFVMRMTDPSLTLNKDAAELLRLAPGVWVDDRGVSINGTAGTNVYVNEREVHLNGKALTDYLRNFRSSDILRVEVIPQVGAEFSADSQGGIVKITLRRQLKGGLSGNLQLSTSQGKSISAYNPAGTINARSGKWSFNTLASGQLMEKGKDDMGSTRQYHTPGEESFEAFIQSDKQLRTGMVQAGIVFDPDMRYSFGLEGSYSYQSDRTPSQAEALLHENGMEIHTTGNYRMHETTRNRSLTFNYVHQLDTIGSTLKFIVDYTDINIQGDNSYQALYNLANIGQKDSLYRSEASSTYKIFTADFSISKKLRGKWRLDAGAKYTHNQMNDNVDYEGQWQGRWLPLPLYSYDMNYAERIAALYAIVSNNFGPLSMTVGLRGEHTHTQGQGREVRKDYTDFFPNLNLTYAFDPLQLMLLTMQYSRSIERPNFNYLNPNRIQFDEYSYSVGNPTLRPTYINKLSLTAVWHYRYILSIGGNLHKDLVRERTQTDATNPSVTYVMPQNNHRENHWFAMLSFPVKFSKRWTMNGYFLGVRQDIIGSKGESTSGHWLYFINQHMSYRFNHDWYLELIYSGQSRLYSANAGIKSLHTVSLNAKKQLLGKRLTLSLEIYNLTNAKTRFFTHTESFSTHIEERAYGSSRYAKLGIQYNFSAGKDFKQRSVESGQDEEKKRLNQVNQYEQ